MSASGLKLRDYQAECIDIIDNLDGGAHLVQMATGLGKTVTFANIHRHGRMLILSHRDELVAQPVKYFDCPVGIEKAGSIRMANQSSPVRCRPYRAAPASSGTSSRAILTSS